MIGIKIDDRGTIMALQKISRQVQNPAALLKIVGLRGQNELKRYFRNRLSEPNKLGAPKTNFWRDVADHTVSRPEGDSRVRIIIGDFRFAQKVFGGPIRPKRAQSLTIPVNPLARGRTVSVFEDSTGIKLFLLRKKGGALGRALAGDVNGKIEVFYVLSKGVDQDPDPNALPPKEEFQKAILDQAKKELRRQIAST